MSFDHHDTSETSGQIQLIIGPMFSGKTTELLRRIRRYTIAKRRCLIIKYEADKRYSDECAATHDNNTHEAISCSALFDVKRIAPELLDEVDVIGVDEGQFYPDLLEFCEQMANAGKVVMVAALDATFQRKAFGAVVQLIPMAEKVDKFSAVCMCCGASAAFTSRLSADTAVEVIGGADLYISTCRKCFANSHFIYKKVKAEEAAQESRTPTPKLRPTSSSNSPSLLPIGNAQGGGSPSSLGLTESPQENAPPVSPVTPAPSFSPVEKFKKKARASDTALKMEKVPCV